MPEPRFQNDWKAGTAVVGDAVSMNTTDSPGLTRLQAGSVPEAKGTSDTADPSEKELSSIFQSARSTAVSP